jgi:hypothetical protein
MWDATAMDAAIYGLAGIVVGAVLSWLGSMWSEKRKERHEGRMLVRGEKLEAYASFSAATKEYMAVLYRVAAHLGIDDQTEKMTMKDATPLFADAFQKRDRAFEQIRIVGSNEAIARARAWVRQIYDMRNYLKTRKVVEEDWQALRDGANLARDSFHALVRQELAVS